MKQYIALSLLVGACAVALFSLFGDDSYSRMQSLKRSIEKQQVQNRELEERVTKLQSEIVSIRFDDKKLEDSARNDLGMARPNEIIFRFESSLDEEQAKIEEQRKLNSGSHANVGSSASVIRKSDLADRNSRSEPSQSVIR